MNKSNVEKNTFAIPSFDAILTNVKNKFTKNDLFSFVCGFLACLLTNIFMYTNTTMVHDSTQFYNNSTGLTNGRFLISFLFELTNRLQLPWAIGILTCLFFGSLCVAICRLFNIKRKISYIFVSFIMATSVSTATFHYYFSSAHIYVFCMFLAALGVYFARQSTIKGYILSVLCIISSIALYQAGIAFAATLLFSLIIVDIIKENDFIADRKAIWKRIFLYGIIIAVSMVIYYILWKCALTIFNTQTLQYYAYNEQYYGFSFLNLWRNVLVGFLWSFKSFFLNATTIRSPFLAVLTISSNVLAVLFILLNAKKKRKFFITLFLILSVILVANMIVVINGQTMYQATMFAFVIFQIFLIYFIDNGIFVKNINLRNISQIVSVVLIALTCFSQFVQANAFYTKWQLNYQNSWSVATRLVDRIEQTDGLENIKKIVFVGNGMVMMPNKTNQNVHDRLTEFPGMEQDYEFNTGFLYLDCVKWFIEDEMDRTFPEIVLDDGTYEDMNFVQELNEFPKNNCIVIDGDTMVVKLSCHYPRQRN